MLKLTTPPVLALLGALTLSCSDGEPAGSSDPQDLDTVGADGSSDTTGPGGSDTPGAGSDGGEVSGELDALPSGDSIGGDTGTDSSGGPDVPEQVLTGPSGLPSDAWQTTCRAPATGPRDSPVVLVPAFPNLELRQAIALVQAPGAPDTWYAVEQGVESDAPARIVAFPNSPTASNANMHTLLAMPPGLSYPGIYGEGGLLGFAFAPDWQTSGVAYVSYTVHSATSPVDLANVISRVHSLDSGKTLDFDTEERLLVLDQPESIHNGGAIAIGPDGMLYVALGDGGGEPDDEVAQDPTQLLGKILRLKVGATGPYTIPLDNPFVDDAETRPEIYALGVRSPWKFSFDRTLGDLWLGDVGDEEYEEIDRVPAGANLGWPVLEGYACFSGADCDPTGFTEPMGIYKHFNPETEEPTGNQAVTGGYVYRGSAIPALVGTYVLADFLSGEVMGLDAAGGYGQTPTWLGTTHRMIVSLAEDLSGELYALDYNEGTVFALRPAPTEDTFPRKLSATGCVDPNDPTAPVAGMIPYELNAPFWSDGAEKHRWLAVPGQNALELLEDGDIEFPIGTVLMKEFQLAGTRVETRLFVRHDDGSWAGYSYQWNAEGTDADLVSRDGAAEVVKGQRWIYPARNHCGTCHNEVSAYVLGPEVQQLNRDVTYAATGKTANQLDTWNALGLFEEPFERTYSTPALPDPFGTNATEDERARAYLHANCAYCHRLEGTDVPIDLSYSTPLPATGTCEIPADLWDFDEADMKLLAPGKPQKSAILRRMRSEDRLRMPPLSTRLVDVPGAALIESWIANMPGCAP